MKPIQALTAVAVTCIALCGCKQESNQSTSQAVPAGAEPTVAPVSPSEFAQSLQPQKPAPTSAETSQTQEVSIKLRGIEPLMPLKGTVQAYTITSTSQLIAGPMADAFIGDFVLANDVMKAVIGKPSRKGPTEPTGGHLIDLLNLKNPVDFFGSAQTVADLDTTGVELAYDRADKPFVEDKTTATLAVYGYLGRRVPDAPDTAPLSRIEGVDVITTYALPRNENYVCVTTRFENHTSAPVSLLPGDIVDWGMGMTFLEGIGLVPPNATVDEPVLFASGTTGDWTAGVVTSGTGQLIGLHGNRKSLVYSVGVARPRTTPAVAPAIAPSAPAAEVPPPGPRPVMMPPRTETLYQAKAPVAETTFAPGVPAAPGPETRYQGPASPQPETRETPTTQTKGAPGGGGEAHDSDTTESQTGITGPDAASRVTIPPGGAFEFVRYYAVSDIDSGRISSLAYRVKGVTTGTIAGITLEGGDDNKPVAGAEIRILGGPNWNQNGQPKAFMRLYSRADGSFEAAVPAGNYAIMAIKNGRQAISAPAMVRVAPKGEAELIPIVLSPISYLNVAVMDADSPTTVPLPCKVILQAKKGTPTLDFGTGPDVSQGVQNTFYLPYGAAHIPLTPGKYRMTIARGIEYGIIEHDIEVAPGMSQTIIDKLPHLVKVPGLIALDAGVMTSASAVSTVNARDRVVMAACEGVPLLVTGDYGVATDLQPVIRQLGLEKWIRAFPGIRLLVDKDDFAADLLVYPLDASSAKKVQQFNAENEGMPPDVFIADLRQAFPDLLIQVNWPTDSQRGYLERFAFNVGEHQFVDPVSLPPSDFDAIQLVPGKHLADFDSNAPRFNDLLVLRSQQTGGVLPLSPTGGSEARLPFGEEVGYPRMYLYTRQDTIDAVTTAAIAKAIRGQHLFVTNGPLLIFSVKDPKTDRYSVQPGDIVDLASTSTLNIKINVVCPPWIDLGGFTLNVNGLATKKVEVMPSERVIRYPIRNQPDADIYPQQITEDSFVSAEAYSTRRSLKPVVQPNPGDFGGEVMPFAWTGPIFVDKNGDGKLSFKRRHP